MERVAWAGVSLAIVHSTTAIFMFGKLKVSPPVINPYVVCRFLFYIKKRPQPEFTRKDTLLPHKRYLRYSPTAKLITTKFLPRRAKTHERLALVVVLTTPTLPDSTTMISSKGFSPGFVVIRDGAGGVSGGVVGEWSLQHRDLQLFVFQPDLHRLAVQFLRDVFQHLVVAGDGDQFGVECTAEDTCLFVALRAGQRAPAQGAVDVHRAVGDDLRAGTDRGQHGQVAVVGVDLLARAHRGGLDEAGLAGGGGSGPGFRLFRSG